MEICSKIKLSEEREPNYLCYYIIIGMKSEIDSEDGGPDRHSAELRIKKAQVCSYMFEDVRMCVFPGG